MFQFFFKLLFVNFLPPYEFSGFFPHFLKLLLFLPNKKYMLFYNYKYIVVQIGRKPLESCHPEIFPFIHPPSFSFFYSLILLLWEYMCIVFEYVCIYMHILSHTKMIFLWCAVYLFLILICEILGYLVTKLAHCFNDII